MIPPKMTVQPTMEITKEKDVHLAIKTPNNNRNKPIHIIKFIAAHPLFFSSYSSITFPLSYENFFQNMSRCYV